MAPGRGGEHRRERREGHKDKTGLEGQGEQAKVTTGGGREGERKKGTGREI